MKTSGDTIVFDIETSNFFTDPGVGWNNFGALKISVVGAYSYGQEKYFCFEESEMEQLAQLFATASRLVGFSLNRYDVPVLNLYFKKLKNFGTELDLWKKERVDLLEEVELQTGHRISLSRLAMSNLGVGKESHGSQAIGMFEAGMMEELKTYCLKDVELTKNLYDFYLRERHFMVPDRETGQMRRLDFSGPVLAQKGLF